VRVSGCSSPSVCILAPSTFSASCTAYVFSMASLRLVAGRHPRKWSHTTRRETHPPTNRYLMSTSVQIQELLWGGTRLRLRTSTKVCQVQAGALSRSWQCRGGPAKPPQRGSLGEVRGGERSAGWQSHPCRKVAGAGTWNTWGRRLKDHVFSSIVTGSRRMFENY
jgi:hypothetical protein